MFCETCRDITRGVRMTLSRHRVFRSRETCESCSVIWKVLRKYSEMGGPDNYHLCQVKLHITPEGQASFLRIFIDVPKNIDIYPTSGLFPSHIQLLPVLSAHVSK